MKSVDSDNNLNVLDIYCGEINLHLLSFIFSLYNNLALDKRLNALRTLRRNLIQPVRYKIN